MIVYNYDADLEVSDTCVRSSLLSRVELFKHRASSKLQQQVWRRDSRPHFGFGTTSGPSCDLDVLGVNPTAASAEWLTLLVKDSLQLDRRSARTKRA